GVEIPAASYRVGGLRYTDAFIEWARAREPGKGKVAHHPAISDLIVECKRVTIILVIATGIAGTQGSKERVVRGERGEWVARLVPHSEPCIDCLQVMVRAHIAVCIRRPTIAPAPHPIGSVKCEQRRRHVRSRGKDPLQQRLELREGRGSRFSRLA